MRSLLKIASQMILSFIVGAVFSFFIFESVLKSKSLSANSEIAADDNITLKEDATTRRAILMSRESAVQIMSASEDTPVVSSSSGTYIRYNNRYYVLTVAHAIMGSCSNLRILAHQEMYHCKRFAAIDRYTDYAIIEVDKLLNRKPVRIKRSVPGNFEWSDAIAVQSDVFYTGYPNALGPLTINGKIVGHDYYENVFVHSFAWPGSSGSGVFNDSGEFIGFIMAISVGATEFGVTVLEDIAIVVPLYQIDWSAIEKGDVENGI